MKKKRLLLTLRIIGVLVFVSSVLWLISDEFHYEPLVGMLTSLAALIATFSETGDEKTAASAYLQSAQNRDTVLNLVWDFWIDGVLEQSMHDLAMIDLGMEERKRVVDNRLWDVVVQTENQPDRLLPKGTRISSFFSATGESLLILGEPGSGKTTTLLSLAKDLIQKARTDTKKPVPVVFNLSSWSTKFEDLDAWLLEQLSTNYFIPESLAKNWLDSNRLALLLDGLDEVEASSREHCINHMNDYRQKHGYVPMAVCSRTAEYTQARRLLSMRSAVVLQPLSQEQIDEFLADSRVDLAATRMTLAHDKILREMVTTPLMLSLMVLAYQGKSAEELQKLGSVKARRRHLFGAYIQQMFWRYGKVTSFEHEDSRQWLRWLANRMKENNQTLFFIENLQPGWLSSFRELRNYIIVSRLGLGILFGISIALSALGVQISLQDLALSVATIPVYLLGSIAAGMLVLAPVLILLDLFHFRSLLEVEQEAGQIRTWSGRIAGCLFSLAWGFVAFVFLGVVALLLSFSYTGLFVGLIGGIIVALLVWRRKPWQKLLLLWGMVIFITGALLSFLTSFSTVIALVLGVYWYVVGLLIMHKRLNWRTLDKDIRLLDKLNWSLSRAWRGFVVGAGYVIIPVLVLALILELFTGWLRYVLVELTFIGFSYSLTYTYAIYLILTVFSALVLGVLWASFQGIEGNTVRRKVRPNQGIWLTLRNGAVIGLIIGLVIGILSTLFALFVSLIARLELTGQIVWGVLPLSVLLISLPIVLYYGLIDFLYHIAFRFTAVGEGHMPWDYSRFLYYAGKLLLMRRVGGGFIFIHRLVMEHLADLYRYKSLRLKTAQVSVREQGSAGGLGAGAKRSRVTRTAIGVIVAGLLVGCLASYSTMSFFQTDAEPVVPTVPSFGAAPVPTPRVIFVQGVVAARDIPANTVITLEDVRLERFLNDNVFIIAGTNIESVDMVVGRKLRHPVDAGIPINLRSLCPDDACE